MTYREQLIKSALESLQKLQLSFASLKYILDSQYMCSPEVIIKYDIHNKLSKFDKFLKYYRRDALLDFVETHVFEECIETCEELTSELELYNEYLFGEKRYITQTFDYKDVGFVYAPYIPVTLPSVAISPSPCTVSATTRKLKAQWSQEAIEDFKNMHSFKRINQEIPLALAGGMNWLLLLENSLTFSKY
jgi:hypothetical protein